jgi:galacturan 1,4-alpha-galacturonidase
MHSLLLSVLGMAAAVSSRAIDSPSPRPEISCHPFECPGGHHSFPLPGRVCYVESAGEGKDDAMNILSAVHKCNNGGRVVFRKGVEYIIGTALDLTFMNNIDLGTFLLC